jgi:hypothetical protein
MATVNSVGYNTDNATPPVNHGPQLGGGRVRMFFDTYTQGASAGSIGDVIQFKSLPPGARILPGAKMFNSAGVASATLAVGTTDSAARFLAATSITSAGSALMEAQLAAGAVYDVPSTGIGVIATNAGAAIQAAQVISIFIPYVID